MESEKNKTPEKKLKSSMSHSSEVICRDEECIGKNEETSTDIKKDTEAASDKKESLEKSSISVDRKKICDDDQCIGLE